MDTHTVRIPEYSNKKKACINMDESILSKTNRGRVMHNKDTYNYDITKKHGND